MKNSQLSLLMAWILFCVFIGVKLLVPTAITWKVVFAPLYVPIVASIIITGLVVCVNGGGNKHV